ncbi:hypothetical protein PRZ48_003127 [Zasmidium cellare]|uniref:Uncharacterized protein n=1 Tax=Zasmidium cellare TaxID=395010 RepID=A0ABR0EU53_ZASCE|nr:hypothetical protein PRZ48_003127 [Zasmidium cellare]
MATSPDSRYRKTPSGPRDLQTISEPIAQISPSADVDNRRGYPEMVQTSTKSALLPSTSKRHAQTRKPVPGSSQSTQPTVRAVQDPESAPPVDRHHSTPTQSSSYMSHPDRNYPHAPPPARHRSRSPANSPPASRTDTHPTTSHHSQQPPPQTSSTSQHLHRAESSRQRAPFQSAQAYHTQRRHDPHRLLPTPVRPARGFSFELAPANNEFVYTPPRTSDNENMPTDQSHPPPFRPVLRPVPGTLRDVSANDLALVFARPPAFDDSRRMPQDMPEGPNMRQEFAQGFIYEHGVDYESVEEEMPSSPPVFDQSMLFDDGGMEMEERYSTIRQVSEDDRGDFSQVEMPGMWR